MKIKLEWREIESNQSDGTIYIAKVPGGWFVKSVCYKIINFIPDPNHSYNWTY